MYELGTLNQADNIYNPDGNNSLNSAMGLTPAGAKRRVAAPFGVSSTEAKINRLRSVPPILLANQGNTAMAPPHKR